MNRANHTLSSARRWLYGGSAFLAATAVLLGLAVRAMGPTRVHARLGGVAYNDLVGLANLYTACGFLLLAVVIDVALVVLVHIVRMIRTRSGMARALWLALLVGPPVAVLASAMAWSLRHPHPLTDLPIAWIRGESTHFAPGYSDSAFLQVVPGMPRPEVLQILGEPLHAWGHGRQDFATWSVEGSGGSWWRRLVVFDRKSNTVLERQAGLVID